MKKAVLFLLALTTVLSSCKEAVTTGSLEIVFKAVYNGSPVVMYENNATSLSEPTQIQFTKLEFFIGDLKATKSNQTVDLKEVDYVNLTGTTTTETAALGASIIVNDLEAGAYSNFNLGVGLPDATNENTPGDYSTESPLGLNSLYWASWSSYILSKVEGTATKSDNSSLPFMYHSGVNGMYQSRSFVNSFDIRAGETTQIVITLDAAKFFFDANNTIDLVNNPMTHSGAAGSTAYALALQSITNIANSMTID